jgi:hypothetical protein
MNSTIPIFKQALQSQWDMLAPVIQAHYRLSPFTEDSLQIQGSMESVSHSLYTKFLLPFITLVGALVPYQGRNVPLSLINATHNDKAGLYWQRIFFFPNRKPLVFRSVTYYIGPQKITEYVRFGFGLRFKITAQSGGVIYRDNGYVWKIGKFSIPIPVHLVMGRAYVEEMPISDTEFSMKMILTHPVFGQTFQYNGKFSIVDS